ncbi:MAG: hypothetical protein PVI40_01820 [Chlamydiota bacterium]|jgi:hypothetical protein
MTTEAPSLTGNNSVSFSIQVDDAGVQRIITTTDDRRFNWIARQNCSAKRIFDVTCNLLLTYTAVIATWDLYFHNDGWPESMHLSKGIEFSAKLTGIFGIIGSVASYAKSRFGN